MTPSSLPFSLTHELSLLVGEYASTHKELDPPGVIQYVADHDTNGHKLFALLQSVMKAKEAKDFPHSEIWLSKTIERLDAFKSRLTTEDLQTLANIQSRSSSIIRKRKPEDALQSECAAKVQAVDTLSPLYGACLAGLVDTILLFVNGGADVRQKNGPNDETALHAAVRSGNLQSVQLMIQQKIDINALTKSGETALYLAIKANHDAAAIELLKAGAHSSLRNGPNGETALHAAIGAGNKTMVEKLLLNKTDRNALTKSNISPLYLALDMGYIDIALDLIRADANVNARNGSDYETALHLAARIGNGDVLLELLLRKSEKDPVTKSGMTPLFIAFQAGHYGIAHTLLGAGANINAKNGSEGKTILHLAAERDLGQEIRALAEFKPNLEVETNARKKPLPQALQLGHNAAIEALQALGAKESRLIDKSKHQEQKMPPSPAPMAGKAMPKPVAKPAPTPTLFLGNGLPNPGIKVCFLNATLQAVHSCRPFLALIQAAHSLLKPPQREELRALLALPATKKSLIFCELAISLGLYPRAKEDSPFPRDTTLTARETYLKGALASLKIDPTQLQNLNSLLTCTSTQRKSALSDLVLETVVSLFDRIEGTNQKGAPVDSESILALRHMVTVAGFPAQKPTSQEDAQEFLLFLLDLLDAPIFQTKTQILHEFDFPIPPLELQKGVHSCLLLNVSEAAQGTTIEQLVIANVITEEIEKKAILKSESLIASEPEMEAIHKLPDMSKTQTLQTISLKKDDIPPFLPISLRRYIQTGVSYQKVSTTFPLSKTLHVPLVDNPSSSAQFQIASIVVHDGSSPHGGHYRAYTLMEIEGASQWVEFDDGKITLRQDGDKVEEDIAKNSYLLFYTYRK